MGLDALSAQRGCASGTATQRVIPRPRVEDVIATDTAQDVVIVTRKGAGRLASHPPEMRMGVILSSPAVPMKVAIVHLQGWQSLETV